jgi:hypothetical protein
LSAGKKNLPETLFFQFFIAFGGATLYIFLAGGLSHTFG